VFNLLFLTISDSFVYNKHDAQSLEHKVFQITCLCVTDNSSSQHSLWRFYVHDAW